MDQASQGFTESSDLLTTETAWPKLPSQGQEERGEHGACTDRPGETSLSGLVALGSVSD